MHKRKPFDERQLWADLDAIAKEGRRRLEAKGLTEKDILRLVENTRKTKQKAKKSKNHRSVKP